jgi:lysyl-tRNA synthetase class 2
MSAPAMDDRNEQMEQRIKKLEALRALGVDPYGHRFNATHTAEAVRRQGSGEETPSPETGAAPVRIAGRIVSFRRFGKTAFAHLQDVTGRIQVYFKKDGLTERAVAVMEQLDLGDWIGVTGAPFKTKTGELTVGVEDLVLLSKALRPLPEKWHGLSDVELRYRQRYLDLIVNPESRRIFDQRAKTIHALRSFLNENDFREVETPMMHPIPGGAAARPFVTHHNALDSDLYLRIAPELYLKRLVVGGLERVYEINRNFRNEGISTVHNPEFTMLEFYMAHADYRVMMEFTEKLFCFVAERVLGRLKFQYQDHEIDLQAPWKRTGFTEAVMAANGLDEKAVSDPAEIRKLAARLSLAVPPSEPDGKILQEIFEKTVEPSLIQPTFVTDYPTDISPLAKRKADRPGLTDRFELFVSGMEVANGFSELNDPLDQRSRFEDQVRRRAGGDAEAQPMDEDYLRALEHGMPPTAGEGIGIDRLVMLLTNQTSIREVILFPLLRPESK